MLRITKTEVEAVHKTFGTGNNAPYRIYRAKKGQSSRKSFYISEEQHICNFLKAFRADPIGAIKRRWKVFRSCQ